MDQSNLSNFTNRHFWAYFGIVTIIFSALFVTIAWAKNRSYPATVESPAKTTLVVGLKWVNQAQFAGMYIAQEKGFYKAEGLNVILQEPKSSNAKSGDMLINGDLDFALLNSFDVLMRKSEGQPIKALAAIYQISPSALVSLKDTQIKSPKDLRNKTLGIGSDKDNISYFYALLLKYKVPTNSVKFVNTDFKGPEALTQGEAQVINVYRSDLYDFEKNNVEFNLLLPENFGLKTYNDLIVTTEKMLREHPSEVRAFLKATLAGWDYALSHPEEAAQISFDHASGEQKILEKQRHRLADDISFIKPTPESKIGMMHKEIWQNIYNQLKDNTISANFDFTQAYTTDFLPK